MRNRPDKKIRIPKQSQKTYHETLGKLLAAEKVNEIKAAQYGKLSSVDRFNSTIRLPAKEGFKNIDRERVYRRSIQLYNQNEIVRPAINLIASSIFSSGQPDIKGKDLKLVELAQTIIQENDLNFHDLAREAELAGDVFLAFDTPNKERTQVLSLDAGRTSVVLKDNNIRDILGYNLSQSQSDSQTEVNLKASQIQHLKFNSTTTSLYGQSSLRHVIYWLDVLDFLFESKWLRGADNYGQPLLVVTGVPPQFQSSFKSTIESEVQRAGKTWVLPPDTDVKTPDFSLNYPIGDIVGWVFRMISIATEIPITLLGSADASSRGSAFFANPRFVLAIKPRREIWRIGLRRFFIKLFKADGLITKDAIVTNQDFDIGFLPIFERDLTDIADVMAIYRGNKAVSLETMQEFIGLDASVEKERIDKEPKPEVDDTMDQTNDPIQKAKDSLKAKAMLKKQNGQE